MWQEITCGSTSPTPRYCHACVAYPSGNNTTSVLVFGGCDADRNYSDIQLLEISPDEVPGASTEQSQSSAANAELLKQTEALRAENAAQQERIRELEEELRKRETELSEAQVRQNSDGPQPRRRKKKKKAENKVEAEEGVSGMEELEAEDEEEHTDRQTSEMSTTDTDQQRKPSRRKKKKRRRRSADAGSPEDDGEDRFEEDEVDVGNVAQPGPSPGTLDLANLPRNPSSVPNSYPGRLPALDNKPGGNADLFPPLRPRGGD